MEKLLRAEDLAKIRAGTEKDMGQYHHSIGLWIRNRWGLWGGSDLATSLENLGLRHPDDMSAVILTSFWRYLHNRPLGLLEQVEEFRRYAFDSAEHDCSQGDSDGCARLGFLYQRGEGTARDMKLARLNFERSCSMKNALGCFYLADLPSADVLGSARQVKALRQQGVLYQEAECREYEGVQCFFAGQEFESGRYVKRDPARARSCYEIACKNGLKQGCEALKRVGTEK